MPLPLTPTTLDAKGLQELTHQGQAQAVAGFGKVSIVSLNTLELTTNTVGSTLSAPATAVLRVQMLGDAAMFSLDTYAQMTVAGATCTQLRIRLPYGLKGISRTPLSGGPETRQGIARCMIIDAGAGFVNGFLAIEGGVLTVTRDAVAAFTVGTVGVYGQVWAEVGRPDEA